MVRVDLLDVARQENVLLAESANGGETRDGFREPGENWGSGDRIQALELTGGVEIVPTSPKSAGINNPDIPHIRHDADVEPSQRWYGDEEGREENTNDNDDPDTNSQRTERALNCLFRIF